MAAPTTDERAPEPDATSSDGPSGTRAADRLGPLLMLVPVAVLVVLGWTHRWVEEDAFLNFRIVDQIRAGHGPVFNIGQRVEVATSPLWLAMLTVARTVLPFVRIEYLSIAGGLLLTGLGLWWMQRGAARLWRTDRVHPAVPFGAVVIAALPASWEWATSGLENGLSLAWMGALMLVLSTFARRDAPSTAAWKTAAAGVLLGLGPLVRPDLTIMSAAALVAVLVARRPRGRVARVVPRWVLRPPRALRDLPHGVLRDHRAQHRAGEGRRGHVLVAGLELPGRPGGAVLVVGAAPRHRGRRGAAPAPGPRPAAARRRARVARSPGCCTRSSS